MITSLLPSPARSPCPDPRPRWSLARQVPNVPQPAVHGGAELLPGGGAGGGAVLPGPPLRPEVPLPRVPNLPGTGVLQQGETTGGRQIRKRLPCCRWDAESGGGVTKACVYVSAGSIVEGFQLKGQVSTDTVSQDGNLSY